MEKSPESRPIDVAESLRHAMGDTGDLQETLGGFRIRIHHTRSFPWGEVFKTLLFRDFKVYVTRQQAELFIEANP
jgi:hypothetical protein